MTGNHNNPNNNDAYPSLSLLTTTSSIQGPLQPISPARTANFQEEEEDETMRYHDSGSSKESTSNPVVSSSSSLMYPHHRDDDSSILASSSSLSLIGSHDGDEGMEGHKTSTGSSTSAISAAEALVCLPQQELQESQDAIQKTAPLKSTTLQKRKREKSANATLLHSSKRKRKTTGYGSPQDTELDFETSNVELPDTSVYAPMDDVSPSNKVKAEKSTSSTSGKQKSTQSYSQRLKGFYCVCCNKYETNGRVYTFKSFSDVYHVLFPDFKGEDGDVCRNCYNLGYKLRTWRKSHPKEDPLVFVESLSVSRQVNPPSTTKLQSVATEKAPSEESILDASSPSAAVGHMKTRSTSSSSLLDEASSHEAPQPTLTQNGKNSNLPLTSRRKKGSQYARLNVTSEAEQNSLLEKLSDDLIEVFLDIRSKGQDNDYSRMKIIREFVPSKSTRHQLVDAVKRNLSLISQRRIEGESNSGMSFSIDDIKLAERDSNAVDLEIDLITEECFKDHPIRPKSRFIAYIRQIQLQK